jgi:lysophospholipase L1-like esterase
MIMPPIHEFPAFTRFIKWTVGGLVRLLGKELKIAVSDIDDVYFSEEVIQLDSWQKKYKIVGNRSEFFSDGVHPSELAYQVWAKDLVDFVMRKKII